MLALLLKSSEVIFARIAPGALNLLAIALLGRYLQPADYGQFSTILATTALVGLLTTGPVRFAIVPRRASYGARGDGGVFEQAALSLLVLITLAVFALCMVAWLLDLISLVTAALIGASSLFNGWLPVLRARLQFWRFGLASWANAVLVIGIVYLLVGSHPTPANALWAFTVGNLSGFVVGWIACGTPLPGALDRTMSRDMLNVGSTFTISNLAENGINLGSRYVVLWFGSPEFLGLFSFCVDLAQRSVGVVINVLAFALVPTAYNLAANSDARDFSTLLKRGAAAGLALSFGVLAAIYALQAIGLLEGLLGRPLDLILFSGVSVAVVTNRLKKMVLDPVAVQEKVHRVVPIAYFAIAPPAVGLAAVFAWLGLETSLTYIYPLGYICVAGLTAALIRTHSRRLK